MNPYRLSAPKPVPEPIKKTSFFKQLFCNHGTWDEPLIIDSYNEPSFSAEEDFTHTKYRRVCTVCGEHWDYWSPY